MNTNKTQKIAMLFGPTHRSLRVRRNVTKATINCEVDIQATLASRDGQARDASIEQLVKSLLYRHYNVK